MGMATRADAVVTYTQEIARQLKETLEPEKVFVAQNTLDTQFLFSEYDRLSQEGKTSVRRRLDLPDRQIVLYLGRLIEEKGTRQIINIVNRLSTDNLLLVIGEGPERGFLERTAQKKGVDVRFTGSINDDRELAPFIYASDVLLNPGYVGLSVVHAFALGVPIVAPAPSGPGRYHSPEWVHVRSGENGLLVDDPTEERMSTAVRDILADQVLYSEAAQKYARESLSIDRMLDGLMEAIQYVSSKQ
jgi:glycosyltransferase involved in cell wall biosynthesis